MNVDDVPGDDPLVAGRARDELRAIMAYAVEQLGPRQSLTAAIDAVPPFDPTRAGIEHTFDGQFTLGPMTPEQSAPSWTLNGCIVFHSGCSDARALTPPREDHSEHSQPAVIRWRHIVISRDR